MSTANGLHSATAVRSVSPPPSSRTGGTSPSWSARSSLVTLSCPRQLVAMEPTFHNRVLVSTEGSIGRPRRKLPSRRSHQGRSVPDALAQPELLEPIDAQARRIRHPRAFGRKLVALHQPHRMDWAARFGIPHIEPAAAAPAPSRTAASKERKPSGIAARPEGPRFRRQRPITAGSTSHAFDGQIYCIKCQQRIAPLRHT